MKALKSLFLVLLFSAICLQKAKAQYPDYVITVNGDSIACQISTSIIEVMRYKTAAMNRPEKLDPDLIREYYVAKKNTLYRSVFDDDRKKAEFMAVLEKGKISLYALSYTKSSDASDDIKLSNTGMVTTTHFGSASYKMIDWYISKANNVIAIKTNDLLTLSEMRMRKDTFAKMLKDNSYIYNRYIADDEFSNDQIRNIIHLYNTGHPMELYSDYVIRKNRDTVLCEIEQATSSTPARYKPNPKDRFTKIDTSITQYFLVKDSSTYLLKTLPKNSRRQYVKLLIKGRINLYSHSMDNSAEDSEASLFVIKGNDDLVQIKHTYSRPDKNEKKAFADMFLDNPKLNAKLKNLSFDFKSILDIVSTYNNDLNDEKTSN